MSGLASKGPSSRKNFVASFLLSFILIGATISSTLLMGLTISSQQAWASHLAAPTLVAPTNNQVVDDTTSRSGHN